MFRKVLIANRGEIACRVIRTLDRMGVASVAVYSEADRAAPHVSMAGEAVALGGTAPKESYLVIEKILAAAKQTGAEAIHPGYGFLSENADFAEACEREGIVFIGPTAAQMRDFGLKHTARALAKEAGVPLLPGTSLLDSLESAKPQASGIGYPAMLKSTAGGGGIGMQVCASEAELESAWERVGRLSQANFKSGGMYLEKFVAAARHVEVQVFGDGRGRVLALGERDCSTQRRNQKVVEETPAPNLAERTRQALHDAARKLAERVSYRSAGTVEFVLDADTGAFYFLEVNTRLQVEHGVTELVTGVDLVEWMVRVAAGDASMLDTYEHAPRGASIQVRVYAEDPAKNFQPSSGTLTAVAFPEGVRVDAWVEPGAEVSPFYDPLLAKVMVHAGTRDAAVAKLSEALQATTLAGIETNLGYLEQVVASDEFRGGRMVTRSLATFDYRPATVDVLAPGNFSTIQDYPGRVGYWDVGVPPSGPMDHLSFRLANRLIGNVEGAAALELTVTGPTLRFNRGSVVCLTGARMHATLNDEAVPYGEPFDVPRGATLNLGKIDGPGVRTYLGVRGGFDVPEYLGSRSTFTLGQFGGHGGRTLRAGDVLHLGVDRTEQPSRGVPPRTGPARPGPDKASRAHLPLLTRDWRIGVLYGPHGAPDFFTDADIDTLFSHPYEVHYNSARTGVRLVGPKPQWARRDGGEAGLHPSNIHDNAYAIGAIDFTGDMPVILGPDGPSLGGFVCPAVVVQSELWKIGQLAPGDRVRFVPMSLDEANEAERAQDEMLRSDAATPEDGYPPAFHSPRREVPRDAVLLRTTLPDATAVTVRPAGDRYLLVEFGPIVLDLDLRFRAHALQQSFLAQKLGGVLDLTPGIRSLQIHYDPRQLPQKELLAALESALRDVPGVDDLEVPTRVVHLPLSWDDPAIHLTISKYMQGVRDDAPWCPSNIEFIRRINGLDSIDDVYRIVFGASYLVMGLGDVYLGAPVATPLDPRHRLVTTKYNPARTWTPPNVVGIGGAYLCVYGMEGPGGYQLFGRTIQVWNTYRRTPDFDASRWSLRFFDQIRFFPVSHEELMRLREDFPLGRYALKIEEGTFRLREYHAYLAGIKDSAAAFKAKQQAAFDAERARWAASGEFERAEKASTGPAAASASDVVLTDGQELVASPMGASVWKVVAQPGQSVKPGDNLAILEAMKMETAIPSPVAGRVQRVLCNAGQLVSAGTPLFVIEPDA